MTEPTHMGHPDPVELQRIADGEAGVSGEVVSHVESCAECRAEIDRIQRVTAALSLSSRAPASLASRMASKRTAAASLHATPPAYRRPRYLLPIGLVAAAVLVLLVGRDRTPTPSAEKGIPKPWPEVPLAVSRSLYRGIMVEWSSATLDSAMVAAEADSASTIQLRYDGTVADPSAGRESAARAVTYLASRGVKPERIRVLRTMWELREPVPDAAVQVMVVTLTQRRRP